MAKCVSRLADGILTVTVTGRLDTVGARALQAALDRDGGAVVVVVIDLAGTTYLSSAALRVFTKWARALAAKHGLLAVVGATEYCRQAIARGGRDRVLALLGHGQRGGTAGAAGGAYGTAAHRLGYARSADGAAGEFPLRFRRRRSGCGRGAGRHAQRSQREDRSVGYLLAPLYRCGILPRAGRPSRRLLPAAQGDDDHRRYHGLASHRRQ